MSCKQVISLQNQVIKLTSEHALDSAVLLGSFLVNLSAKLFTSGNLPTSGPGSHVASLTIYADALKANGEFKRSIDYFREALQQRKLSRGGSTFVDRVEQDTIEEAKISDNQAFSTDVGVLEAHIKFQIAQGQISVKDFDGAIKTLDSIPSRFRTSSILLCMGKLYGRNGVERATANIFREALKQNPYALEAALALIDLGINAHDVIPLCVHSPLMQSEDMPWITNLIEAHSLTHANKYSQAMESFVKLEGVFPNHVHLMVQMGSINVELNDQVAAMIMFQKARAADPKLMDGMDTYASLIRAQEDSIRLNNLAKDMLEIDSNKPEPWMAVAYLCDLKEETDRAAHFVDKVLEINPQHLLAHHFKGRLQLNAGRAELSVSSFYKAYSIRRDFNAYRGLVDAYLKIPKVGEALRTAKEALQLMPKDPRAIIMVGSVFSKSKDCGRKAIKAYTKALRIHPQSWEAASALADLFLQQKLRNPGTDLSTAIEIVQKSLQHQGKESMHTKLADLYTANNDFAQALTHYHNALSLKREYPPAKFGLERLEKIMNGLDPDAEEETELDDGDHEYDQE